MSLVDKKILFQELGNIKTLGVEFYLYERVMHSNVKKDYSSWVLCCGINSHELLEEVWEEIVDCFAVYFQADLTLEIERSNLYIVFFVEGKIPNQLKMTIEYDKYSSRKIIINEKYPKFDSEKDKLIENLIFNINEYTEDIETKVLGKWLKEKEPNLDKLYEKFIRGSIKMENVFSEYNKI